MTLRQIDYVGKSEIKIKQRLMCQDRGGGEELEMMIKRKKTKLPLCFPLPTNHKPPLRTTFLL